MSNKDNAGHGGDSGESRLFDGSKLGKNDLIFAALGDIDELSSFLGLAKAILGEKAKVTAAEAQLLEALQTDLVRIGGQVAMPESNPRYNNLDVITSEDVARLQALSDSYGDKVALPKKFISPGGSATGAHIDVARAVCRRAERRIVSCISDKNMRRLSECQRYLNRLSGFLFIFARWLDGGGGKE